MKFFRSNFSRRVLVQNAGLVAGAGLLGLGTGAMCSRNLRGSTESHAPWR